MKTSKKKKLNIKKLFVFTLFLYLIIYGVYYLFDQPIRNIIITGNTYVKDYEIIEASDIKDYPSVFGISTRSLKKKIKSNPLIEDVIIKRDLKFRLYIEVVESKVVLLNNSTNKLMLGTGASTNNQYKYFGVPTLINYADEKVLKKFLLCLGNLDYGILNLISEIEYSPAISDEGVSVDDERFILYMNDENTVFINASKCDVLLHYREIYASLDNKKGFLNLDSGNSENFVFTEYKDE
ncbi:MAG: FtsQ-type POTRA domain-containing protein [Bacilli bacterium]|nr:FtsQ-type POTRA domain-containing protein [Bacilli bacterium]